jgi:hypothetical protein
MLLNGPCRKVRDRRRSALSRHRSARPVLAGAARQAVENCRPRSLLDIDRQTWNWIDSIPFLPWAIQFGYANCTP